jgi:nicotinamide riboside kinase
MDKTLMNYLKGTAFILSLTLVTGCDLLKKKADTKSTESATSGMTLCTIDGEAVITEQEYKNSLAQMIQSNPYFKGASAESLPKELQRKFFEQLSMQALIEKHAIKHDIEKDPEYIKAYNETEKLLKRSLMVQIFEKKIYDGLKVTDEDINKYYNENKERFVKVAGGVLAQGIRFDSDAAATAFLARVKANAESFEKLAKADKNGKFKDFGRLGQEARGFQYEVVPGPVKETALSMTKLPGVEKVKSGKEFWVIKAWDKKETELFGLDEVKSHVEAMLKNNQFRDALDKRLKDLKAEFKVVTNESYFAEPKQEEPKADEPANTDEKPAAEAEEPKEEAPATEPAPAAAA